MILVVGPYARQHVEVDIIIELDCVTALLHNLMVCIARLMDQAILKLVTAIPSNVVSLINFYKLTVPKKSKH